MIGAAPALGGSGAGRPTAPAAYHMQRGGSVWTGHPVGAAAAPRDQLTAFGPARIHLPYTRIFAFSVSCAAVPCTINLTEAAFAGKLRLRGLRDLLPANIPMRHQPGPGGIFATWYTRGDFNQTVLAADVKRYGSVTFKMNGVLSDAQGGSFTAMRQVTVLGPKPKPLTVLLAGSYRGLRPSGVFFSGDGGNIVTGIRWSSWSRSTASGTGTSDILGCVPNCAQGTATPVSTTIVFNTPRAGHFTAVVERRAGQKTFTARYGQPGWPGGAQ